MYSLWEVLPTTIQHKQPFYMLSYADDPLSWGDIEQSRSIYENVLNYYQVTEYKNNNDTRIEEKEDMVIMELKSKNSTNKYNYYKKLYISKSTLKPIRMEVKDINKKMLVYILYNEIKINSTSKEDVLAFKLQEEQQNI